MDILLFHFVLRDLSVWDVQTRQRIRYFVQTQNLIRASTIRVINEAKHDFIRLRFLSSLFFGRSPIPPCNREQVSVRMYHH